MNQPDERCDKCARKLLGLTNEYSCYKYPYSVDKMWIPIPKANLEKEMACTNYEVCP